MSSSKKIDLAAGAYLSEDPSPPMTPYPPAPNTLCYTIRVHTVQCTYILYLFTQERGRDGEMNQREG